MLQFPTVFNELGAPRSIPAKGKVQSLMFNIFCIDNSNSNESHNPDRLSFATFLKYVYFSSNLVCHSSTEV